MEIIVVSIVVSIVVVVALLIWLVFKTQKPQKKSQQFQQQSRVAVDPDTLRRERIEAARQRCNQAEEQSVYEETLLFLEEDTDYHKQMSKETRQARRQRRKQGGS